MPSSPAQPPVFHAGMHACHTYATDAQRRAVAARFLGAADPHERLWYVGPSRDAAGLVPDDAAERLVVDTHAATYLAGGGFDPDRMLGYYDDAIARSLAEGFPGVRILADMAWATDGVVGRERLAAYERAISALLAGRPAVVLCHYDRAGIGEMRDEVEAAHPVVLRGEPLYADPRARIERAHDGTAVSLHGEIDIWNRTHVREALRAEGDEREALFIDGTALRTIDAGFIGIVAALAADRGPARPTRIALPPRLGRLFRLTGVDALPGLALEDGAR